MAAENAISSQASQSDTQALPECEVATVKPAKQDNYKPYGLYVYPGGKLQVKQATLKTLIHFAFGVPESQVSGGPKWIGEDLFDVEGLPPDSSASRETRPAYVNSAPTQEQRQMVQSLLIERFGLKYRKQLRDGAVYLLVKRYDSPQLTSATHKEYLPMFAVGGHGYGGMMGQSVTVPFIASRLSAVLERPVLDRTGIQGAYDFKLEAPSDDSSSQTSNEFIDGIFQSIEKLGLQLKPSKDLVETLVVDSANRPSSED